jgi:peptidoglycan/LPS O-acetylase OafA/YrhL
MVYRPFIAPRFDWAAKVCAEQALPALQRRENGDLTPSPERERMNLPRGHVPALDAVRGLAILAVTLYRFGGGAGGTGSALGHWLIVELGSKGVDLFFVLSGFLITGILFDAKEKEHYFRDFYARRALRIFPLYYATLVAALVLLPLSAGSVAAAFQPAVAGQTWLWIYNANVLQAVRGEWCLGPLNHFWSLAIEEHFYFVWPLVIYLSSRQTALRISGGMVCFCIISRAMWLACGGNDVAAEVLTPLRMDGLALGSWLALAARSPGGLDWLRRYAPVALVLFGVAAVATTMLERRLFGLPYALWAATSGALLILIAAPRSASSLRRIGDSRLLQFLGKYSYGMYVFQLPLITITATVVTARGIADCVGSAAAGQLIYCFAMFVLTTAAAVVSWHVFEKRWLVLKRYFE